MNKFTNQISTDDKNKLSILYYEKFSGEKQVEIRTNNYITYGYIVLDVKSATDLKIHYKDILLCNINGSGFRYLSVAFIANGLLKISGVCDSVKIEISGAKVFDNEHISYLPINSILSLPGCNNLYSVSSDNDFNNGNYSEVKKFNNLMNVQTIKYQNENFVACLFYEDGVYFCTNVDNYTNKIKICDDCKCTCIMPELQNNNIFIIYIWNNKLCYKILTNMQELSDEYYIYENNYDIPVNFSMLEIVEFSSATIGVHFEDGTYSIFTFYNGGWHKVLNKICPKTRIILNKSSVEIVEMFDYYLRICKYVFDNKKSEPLVWIKNSKDYYNVRDVLKVLNGYMLCNCDCKEIINDIF